MQWCFNQILHSSATAKSPSSGSLQDSASLATVYIRVTAKGLARCASR